MWYSTGMMRQTLKDTLKAYYVFVMCMVVIASTVMFGFISYMPPFTTAIALGYTILAIVGQSFVLVSILSVVLLPIVCCFGSMLQRCIVSLLYALLGTLLIADMAVFSLYRFHINWIVIKLFVFGKVATIPWMVVLTAIAVWCLLFFVFFLLYTYITKKLAPHFFTVERRRTLLHSAKIVFVCGVSAFCISHVGHAFATAFAYQPVSVVTRYIPLYLPLRANSFLVQLGIVDRKRIAQQKSLVMQENGSLQYPLKSIQTSVVKNPYNILVIAIDSWRYDSLSELITPNISNFIKKHNGVMLKNHHSTGNATRAGIFGMFYGLPATYWHAFLDNYKPPLLVTRMQQMGYDIGVFFSASTTHPEFHRTVFASIPELTPGAQGRDKIERDTMITNNCVHWLQNVKKPFFGIVFYDAVHGGGAFPEGYQAPFLANKQQEINYLTLNKDTDPTPIVQRYNTAVHFVDSLIQKIVRTLEEEALLDSTLVIITSDHGEEMNDNKLGYWGHNGNFTAAQTHVPFAVILPESLGSDREYLKQWNMYTYRTSHEDIAPTLLQSFLGVTNPVEDYSTGINLFQTPQKRDFFIIASYTMYGIVGDQNLIEVTSAGTYEVRSLRNEPLPGVKPQYDHIAETLKRISKFYK